MISANDVNVGIKFCSFSDNKHFPNTAEKQISGRFHIYYVSEALHRHSGQHGTNDFQPECRTEIGVALCRCVDQFLDNDPVYPQFGE